MPDTGITAYHDSRDPLWRLAPTPFSSCVRVGHFGVRVESNDPQILRILARILPEKSAEIEHGFLWRILRDPEATGGIEPAAILVDGNLSFLNMSPGVFAGVDNELRELLGFVGMGVCDDALGKTVLPMFVQLTLDAVKDDAGMGERSAELAHARGKGNE